MPRLWEIILDALYPNGVACAVCSRSARLNAQGVCGKCSELLRRAAPPVPPQHTDGAAAGLIYEGEARQLVHRFKYEGQRYLADTLAGYITPDPDWRGVMVPVPLHPERLRQRGYNQSELLARSLAGRCGATLRIDLIKRIRQDGSQTARSAQERRANVAGAFKARGCRGMDVILVDDVLTTGSTASECAKALREAGANRVYVVTACVAVQQRGDSPAAQEMV